MSQREPWSGRAPSFGSKPPPRKKVTLIPTALITPQREHDFRILCDVVEPMPVHWDGERTGPCTANGQPCWADHAKIRTIWQFWCHVYNRQTKESQLLCLTQHAWDHCPDLDAENGHLRGARLKVWRKGKSLRGRMWCSFELTPDLCETLMPPCDVRAYLSAMWNAPIKDRLVQQLREQRLNGQPADDQSGMVPL